MSKEKWQALNRQDLLESARNHGIAGCNAMPKKALIAALIRNEQVLARQSAQGKVKPRSSKAKVATKRRSGHVGNGAASPAAKIEQLKHDVNAPPRDLSVKAPRELPKGYNKDRIFCMVRDPYWLHVYWEISRQAVQRAEAALAQDWHGARPILRVIDVSCKETTSTCEAVARDIDIHGGCNSWYVNVNNPPCSYRIDIGYLAKNGLFFDLARSNVVTTPRPGISDCIDENWADFNFEKADKIFAMSGGFDPTASSLELKQLFEERLRRPIGSPAVTSFGTGALQFGKKRKFFFDLEAELIIYGATEPTAKVTLQGEPIKLRSDGTFTMRFSLPDSRQIIPACAASADGIEERTIVLALERNTKHLEPVINEVNE
jgi:hypothetical protein